MTLPAYIALLDQYQASFAALQAQLDASPLTGHLQPALMPQGVGELFATMRAACSDIQDRLRAAREAHTALMALLGGPHACR